MDDILEDSFDQISSFNIIHRGIHARSTTGTEISKTSATGIILGIRKLCSEYSDSLQC